MTRARRSGTASTPCARVLAGGLAGVLACGAIARAQSDPGASAGDVVTSLRAGTATPQFGERFELTVERSWPRALSIAAFDPAWLAPLHLEAIDDERSQRDGRTVETRRYRACVFALGAVVVPASRTPGLGDVTPITLDVRGRLDPMNPGAVELSSELIGETEESSRGVWIGVIAAMAAVLGTAWWRSRRRPLPAAPSVVAPPPPSPHAVARERLVALRGRAVVDARDTDAFHVDAAHLVREFLAATELPSAMEWTTEEIARSLRGLPATAPSRIAEAIPVLRAADLVMFARGGSTSTDRTRLLERIEALLGDRATGEGAST
ncbi:MAG: hypothetical protein AB7I19_14710 [Planctomycetota bacterium]